MRTSAPFVVHVPASAPQALEPENPTEHQLMATAEEKAKPGTEVVFACSLYLNAAERFRPDLIAVPCLGRIHEGILAAAILDGSTVVLVNGHCEGCPNEKAWSMAAGAVEEISNLLGGWGISTQIKVIPRFFSTSYSACMRDDVETGLSRRGFFRRSGGAPSPVQSSATASSVEPVEKAGTNAGAPAGPSLPTWLPGKHVSLLARLRKLERPNTRLYPSQIWNQVAIADSCDGCQMCAHFCPTGALAKTEEGGLTGLAFTASRCTGCGLCQNICSGIRQRHCITLSAQVDRRKLQSENTEFMVFHSQEAQAQHY